MAYEVLTATNGKRGFAVFVSRPVDLVLLELQYAGNEWRRSGMPDEGV